MNRGNVLYIFEFAKTKQWIIMLDNQTVVENAILKTQARYDKFNYNN